MVQPPGAIVGLAWLLHWRWLVAQQQQVVLEQLAVLLPLAVFEASLGLSPLTVRLLVALPEPAAWVGCLLQLPQGQERRLLAVAEPVVVVELLVVAVLLLAEMAVEVEVVVVLVAVVLVLAAAGLVVE